MPITNTVQDTQKQQSITIDNREKAKSNNWPLRNMLVLMNRKEKEQLVITLHQEGKTIWISEIAFKLRVITVGISVMSILTATATIASIPYGAFAKKYSSDTNTQTSAANNDCPADLVSLFVGVQLQTSANCLNDINSVQDSDGTAISSAPFNAAPSQEIELEVGENKPQPPPLTATLIVVK